MRRQFGRSVSFVASASPLLPDFLRLTSTFSCSLTSMWKMKPYEPDIDQFLISGTTIPSCDALIVKNCAQTLLLFRLCNEQTINVCSSCLDCGKPLSSRNKLNIRFSSIGIMLILLSSSMSLMKFCMQLSVSFSY